MKVSVALCTYNGGKYLEQQLNSILDQSLEVHEIVISDDNSSDDTLEVLKKYNQFNSQIIFYQNEQQLGVVKNFEKAIGLCTGDVIFLSDQDDVWKRNKVEKTLQYLDAFPSKLGVFSNADLIDGEGCLMKKELWGSLLFSPGPEASFNLFQYLCKYRNVITGACLAFKKEANQYIFPFTVQPDLLHDEWIGLKLAQKEKLGYIDEPLTQYRIHPHQQTKNMWHRPEVDLINFRLLLRGEVEKEPLYHYRHWKKRTLYINRLKKLGISISDELEVEIKLKRKVALLERIKQKKMLSRKWQLLKYFVKQQENISAVDFIKG